MSGLVPCPGCSSLRHAVAMLETRVAELERKAARHCERCKAAIVIIQRCRACCRDLCAVCMATTCSLRRGDVPHDPEPT